MSAPTRGKRGTKTKSGKTPYPRTAGPPAPIESDGDPRSIPGFPTFTEYQAIEAKYIESLSPRKRAKALINQATFDLIWDVLHDPENAHYGTPQSRFWVRKMFSLESGTPPLVVHDGKPVAVVEQMYGLLCFCHATANHCGRDKTCVVVREHYSWVPKDLTARFVKACPTCLASRNTSGPLATLPIPKVTTRTGNVVESEDERDDPRLMAPTRLIPVGAPYSMIEPPQNSTYMDHGADYERPSSPCSVSSSASSSADSLFSSSSSLHDSSSAQSVIDPVLLEEDARSMSPYKVYLTPLFELGDQAKEPGRYFGDAARFATSSLESLHHAYPNSYGSAHSLSSSSGMSSSTSSEAPSCPPSSYRQTISSPFLALMAAAQHESPNSEVWSFSRAAEQESSRERNGGEGVEVEELDDASPRQQNESYSRTRLATARPSDYDHYSSLESYGSYSQFAAGVAPKDDDVWMS